METSPALSDRIRRTIEIKAPIERVFRAITTESEFSTWFGIKVVSGSFRPGTEVRARSTHPGYEHIEFSIHIERLQPPHLFSWRWIPGAEQPKDEPTTLVQFTLEEIPVGTRVTITESGFDRLSLAYRAKAYKDNTGGWEYQANSLNAYVTQNS